MLGRCSKKMDEAEGVGPMAVGKAPGEVEQDEGNPPEHYPVKARTIPKTTIIVKATNSHSQTLPGKVKKN